MLVPHLGNLGHRRHHGRGRGMYYPYLYPPAYYYRQVEEPVEKYVIVDSKGKIVAVVTGVPRSLPPGYTFRQATAAEIFKSAGASLSGLGHHHGHRGYSTYIAPPAYYYGGPPPEPKYAIIDASGKVIAVVTGKPKGLPAGYDARPATVREAVAASTGTVSGLSGLGVQEDSIF